MEIFSSFISSVRKSLENVYLSTKGSLTNFYLQQARHQFLTHQKNVQFTYVTYFTPKSLLTEVYFTVSEGFLSVANLSLGNDICCFSSMISCPSNQHLGTYLQEQVSCLLKACPGVCSGQEVFQKLQSPS